MTILYITWIPRHKRVLKFSCETVSDSPFLLWNDIFKLDSPLHIVGMYVSSEGMVCKTEDKITVDRSRLLGSNESKLIFMVSLPTEMWGL